MLLLNSTTRQTKVTKREKPVAQAVGYIRVSTKEQELAGDSLAAQAGRIREWAALHRVSITRIHEDTASARGGDSLRRRPGLKAAIAEAQASGKAIVVVTLDRLFRSAAEAEALVRSHGLRIISIASGGPLTASVALSQAAEAEGVGDLIAKRTKSGLAKKKEGGMRLGSPADKSLASKASVKVRQTKARGIVGDVRRFLQADRSRASLKIPALVRELNAAGILTGWGRLWTAAALRRPLRLALEELSVHDEMDAEDDAGPFAERQRANVALQVAADHDDPEDHYKDHPNFGRF
jgi:DNA invertase Pin-like site-specific DNA recombinase